MRTSRAGDFESKSFRPILIIPTSIYFWPVFLFFRTFTPSLSFTPCYVILPFGATLTSPLARYFEISGETIPSDRRFLGKSDRR